MEQGAGGMKEWELVRKPQRRRRRSCRQTAEEQSSEVQCRVEQSSGGCVVIIIILIIVVVVVIIVVAGCMCGQVWHQNRGTRKRGGGLDPASSSATSQRRYKAGWVAAGRWWIHKGAQFYPSPQWIDDDPQRNLTAAPSIRETKRGAGDPARRGFRRDFPGDGGAPADRVHSYVSETSVSHSLSLSPVQCIHRKNWLAHRLG